MKSIRVLKGMQQCEDFTPPPEPSGQRKQMAALCTCCKSDRRSGTIMADRQTNSRVSVLTRLSHVFSREFESAGRSFDLRTGRFEFRWALTEPAIHNVPTALHTDAGGGSNSMTGASEVDRHLCIVWDTCKIPIVKYITS